jgi:hypothetical protein
VKVGLFGGNNGLVVEILIVDLSGPPLIVVGSIEYLRVSSILIISALCLKSL